MTTLTRTLFVLGVLALLAGTFIWFAGYLWAGRECIEGGRGADLLHGREGSIEIVGDSCRATTLLGQVREVPLSEWQWNGPALVAATAGAVALGAATTGWRRRPVGET